MNLYVAASRVIAPILSLFALVNVGAQVGQTYKLDAKDSSFVLSSGGYPT
jgi:hypothetical protein